MVATEWVGCTSKSLSVNLKTGANFESRKRDSTPFFYKYQSFASACLYCSTLVDPSSEIDRLGTNSSVKITAKPLKHPQKIKVPLIPKNGKSVKRGNVHAAINKVTKKMDAVLPAQIDRT